MATGVQTEQLAIEHVKEPRKWMPIRSMKGGKRPYYSRKGKPLRNDRILADVGIVIETDELVADHLGVNRDSRNCQHEHDPKIRSPRGHLVMPIGARQGRGTLMLLLCCAFFRHAFRRLHEK